VRQVDVIVQAPERAFVATETELLNALDRDSKLKKSEAQPLLDEFVMAGWLGRTYAALVPGRHERSDTFTERSLCSCTGLTLHTGWGCGRCSSWMAI
jgi:hypothetical protein